MRMEKLAACCFLCIFPEKSFHTFSSESQVWWGNAPLFRFSTQKGSAKPLFSEDTTHISSEERVFPQKFRNPDACIKVKSSDFPCVFLIKKSIFFIKNEEKSPTWFDFFILSASCQVICPHLRFFSAFYAFDEPSYAFSHLPLHLLPIYDFF